MDIEESRRKTVAQIDALFEKYSSDPSSLSKLSGYVLNTLPSLLREHGLRTTERAERAQSLDNACNTFITGFIPHRRPSWHLLLRDERSAATSMV